MIVSYRDRRTENFANGTRVRVFEPFRRQAEKVLDRLEAATSLIDLLSFPGMRMEKLKGDRAGQYSVRINAQWRACFEWRAGAPGPSNVEIVDYH